MKDKDKKLLLKDLSPRLLYGVRVNFKENRYDSHKWKISTLYAPSYNQSGILIDTDHDGWIDYVEYKGCGMSTGSRPLHLGEVLPYLRPMSSITEEEKEILEDISDYAHTKEDYAIELIDFYNSHHLDFRGLIPMGLALEAPKDMYNLKNV